MTRALDLAASRFAQGTQWPSIPSKNRRNSSRFDEMAAISLQSSCLARFSDIRSCTSTRSIPYLVRWFDTLDWRSIEPSLTENGQEMAELQSLQCSSAEQLATVADRKKLPTFLGPKWVPGGRPLGEHRGLYLSVLIGGSAICPLGVFSWRCAR